MQAHFTPLLKPTNLLTSSLLFGSSLPDVADGSLWDHLLPPRDMCLHQIVEEKEKLIILFQTWGAHKTEQASGNIIFRVHALVLQAMFIHSFLFDRFIQQRVTEGPCLWLYLQILLYLLYFFSNELSFPMIFLSAFTDTPNWKLFQCCIWLMSVYVHTHDAQNHEHKHTQLEFYWSWIALPVCSCSTPVLQKDLSHFFPPYPHESFK